MKLLIRSVLFACFFLYLTPLVIQAADKSSGQPKKKSSIKKLLSRRSTLPSIAESPQHVSTADDGSDHKHNEDQAGQTKITNGRVDGMWKLGGEQLSQTNVTSGQDAADCNNLFAIQPSLEDHFKKFVSTIKESEREEYRTLFYLDAVSSKTRKKNARDEHSHECLCLGQKVLRAALGFSLRDLANINNEHGRALLKCRKELEEAQEKRQAEVVARLEEVAKQKLQQERAQLGERSQKEQQIFQKAQDDWKQQVAQDKITAKRRTYALLGACAISLGGIGLACVSLFKNKPAQTVTA